MAGFEEWLCAHRPKRENSSMLQPSALASSRRDFTVADQQRDHSTEEFRSKHRMQRSTCRASYDRSRLLSEFSCNKSMAGDSFPKFSCRSHNPSTLTRSWRLLCRKITRAQVRNSASTRILGIGNSGKYDIFLLRLRFPFASRISTSRQE